MTAHRTGPGRRRGFTLIELLAAMTILTVMVLLISRIFSDSSRIWQVSAKRVESNTDGRAVIDFMLKELSSALCDGQAGPLALRLDSNAKSSLGLNSDRIFFVASDQRAERRSNDYRQTEQIVYALDEMEDSSDNPIPNRFRLVRYGVEQMGSSSYDCYKPSGFPKTIPAYSGWNPMVLADNVRTLEFWVYTTNGVGTHVQDFYSISHGRPVWIEVYLELLGEDDAIKAALLPAAAAKDFCDRNARRYVGRAYLQANGGKS
jgi:prepilin-type N-terminal cleavage/methylation domain-containing protein